MTAEENIRLTSINWSDPKKLTNEQLPLFVRHEPTEHVVGHEYANGMKVIGAVYEEIARRLEYNEYK